MKSIFANKIHDLPDVEKFNRFQFFNGKPDFEIQISELIISKSTTWPFKFFLPYLVKYNHEGKISKVINLNTCIFEAFFDSRDKSQHFGFYLNLEPYFVESEEVLHKICSLVETTCILSNIHDDFVILKELGRGSTSSVFLAENSSRTGRVAIKNISKTFLDSPSNLYNLYREVTINKKLNHPNVCRLLYIYEDDENVSIVFEYLSDNSLLKVLTRSKSLSESSCRNFIYNLIKTLAYLHEQRIVHRDIKLENIMILDVNSLDFKLIDFGLAFIEGESNLRKCGTPGYMAPEILRGEDYDSKIDIFSIGVVLYTLLHRRLPFNGSNIKSIMNKNLKCSIIYSSSISQDTTDILQLMLNPDPKLRPSAAELLHSTWFSKMISVAQSATYPVSSDSYFNC